MDLKGKIVFSSGKSDDYDIWTLDLTSKEVRQLTTGAYWNDSPRWSPDGKKIVFISNRTQTPEIWMMDEDGSHQTRITDTGKWHGSVDWSPDGRKLVFSANYDGNMDIYIMGLEGGKLEQITDYQGMDFTPRFSPEGGDIIFTSQRSGNDDIWEYNLYKKEFKRLTFSAEKDFSPAYSPDGSMIAFVCGKTTFKDEENLDVYLMDRSGETKMRLTHNSGIDRYVSWSPDGKFLIYTSSRPGSLGERLMLMDVERVKTSALVFDREPLEAEIGAKPECVGLFCLLPEKIIRKFYPETYFGTERSPDWKF